MRRRTAGLAAAVIAVAGTAACAGQDRDAPVCPRAVILADAQAMTRFAPGAAGVGAGGVGAGGGSRLVDFDAEIADLASGCRREAGRDGGEVLVAAVAPLIVTRQGPANRSGRANFFYFVSLVAPDRTIVIRESFASEARFDEDGARVERREDDPPVTIDIPLRRDGSAADYEIVVGLQLSPDELEYNRRRRGGGR